MTTPLPPLPPLPAPGVNTATHAGFRFVGYDATQMQAYATQARADLEAEVQRLRELLAEAADDIESWGAYATDYFQKKHDLQGCVAKYRNALEDTK